MKTNPFKYTLSLIAMLGFSLGYSQDVAPTVAFIGGADNDYLTPGNWDTGNVPTDAETAAIGGPFSVDLAGSVTVHGLILGNDATFSIRSEGHLTVGSGDAFLGFREREVMTGRGTSSLNLEAGGTLDATRHLYIASTIENGRSCSVNLNGGSVNVANRFWVGANAISGVNGTLNINGSNISWVNRVAEMKFASAGKSTADINFILDSGGLTTLTTGTLEIGPKATLTIDFSSYTIAGGEVFKLISYTSRTGTFGKVDFTGLGADQSATIDYGTGTNDDVSVSITP